MSSLEILEVFVLGVIQGIAEFLPISSSAHLIIFRDVFGIGASMPKNIELSFDIALHLGTLLAILAFFFKDFWNMVIKGLTKGVKDKDGKILWYLVAATIPAAIVGVLFEEKIENVIRSNYILIALALIVMGVIIYYVDKTCNQEKKIDDMGLWDAVLVGCSQVFALIPGFSRSGTTIAASRILKLERESAAKFSFFLSAPVVFGAVVLQLMKKGTIDLILTNFSTFLLGIITSFVIGIICIKYLLKYLKKHDFKVFMIYRIILAAIVLLWVAFV